jgi:hypothetical protein
MIALHKYKTNDLKELKDMYMRTLVDPLYTYAVGIGHVHEEIYDHNVKVLDQLELIINELNKRNLN